MNYTYRVQAYRSIGLPIAYQSVQELTVEAVASVLANATVHAVMPASPPWGGYELEVSMTRPSHEDALNEIAGAIQTIGWNTATGLVTEWVTSEIEGSFLGAVGAGAAGSTTKNAGAMLFTAAIGAIGGYFVGLDRKTIKAQYQVERYNGFGPWLFTQLDPAPDGSRQQPVASW
jgi:hypothetical protein